MEGKSKVYLNLMAISNIASLATRDAGAIRRAAEVIGLQGEIIQANWELIDVLKKRTEVQEKIIIGLTEKQEAVPDIEGDARATWWYVCGECHTAVDTGDRYCRQCGRLILWNK